MREAKPENDEHHTSKRRIDHQPRKKDLQKQTDIEREELSHQKAAKRWQNAEPDFTALARLFWTMPSLTQVYLCFVQTNLELLPKTLMSYISAERPLFTYLLINNTYKN